MATKELTIKRILLAGLLFAVLWIICILMVYFKPDFFLNGRNKLLITFFAYTLPVIFIIVTWAELKVRKKKK
ncbi:MAG: hypothetical protein V3V13_05895 [Paracoccaceae bacterium]